MGFCKPYDRHCHNAIGSVEDILRNVERNAGNAAKMASKFPTEPKSVTFKPHYFEWFWIGLKPYFNLKFFSFYFSSLFTNWLLNFLLRFTATIHRFFWQYSLWIKCRNSLSFSRFLTPYHHPERFSCLESSPFFVSLLLIVPSSLLICCNTSTDQGVGSVVGFCYFDAKLLEYTKIYVNRFWIMASVWLKNILIRTRSSMSQCSQDKFSFVASYVCSAVPSPQVGIMIAL